MSITATLTVTPSSPAHGDTLTATYAVQGNDPIPPAQGTVTGDVNIGGTDYPVTGNFTMPGIAALPEAYSAPTSPGLSFVATADPHVWTAVVP